MNKSTDKNCKLELSGICKQYGQETVLDNISFQVRDGELLSILGPSGCGKTTLLRILTGLEQPDRGMIRKNGIDITQTPPDKRGMGIVFQNYALFPQMTALQNVAYALKYHPEWKGREKAAAAEMLEQMGLSDCLNKKPAQLSGGQQQRVAIARTLVLKPDVLLFDEPTAALDAENRLLLREEIKRIQKNFSATILYVTHDQAECFAISDRVLVMGKGKIAQIDTPENILKNPADTYVDHFVGDNLRKYFSDLQSVMKDRVTK